MTQANGTDLRLIEAGFPCHQVGAETKRERDTGRAPPTHRLHVWWARRPLTASRAAVLASLLPADTDPDWFLRQLGIEKTVAMVNGEPWLLLGPVIRKISKDPVGGHWLTVDARVKRLLEREQERRAARRQLIRSVCERTAPWQENEIIRRWAAEVTPFPETLPAVGECLAVRRVVADPFHTNSRLELRDSGGLGPAGEAFRWDEEELYGYGRAYERMPDAPSRQFTVLDPTAGGGSIPLEALRLGHRVLANDLNPVSTIILLTTVDYPLRYGKGLVPPIRYWAEKMTSRVESQLSPYFPRMGVLPGGEKAVLEAHIKATGVPADPYDYEEPVDYLYCRQVTCPRCGGEAPLLNTSWLSKTGQKWAVRVIPDGSPRGGKVKFEPYRVAKGRNPAGADPDFSTVNRGVGTCIHCRQAISSDEIKAQARGESVHGTWKDRLYCVVAVRHQPKLNKHGNVQLYKSGERKGEIKTEKIVFFRSPNDTDLEALAKAEAKLKERWAEWEAEDLIPTERIPRGHKTVEPLRVGIERWCDMFTPRQLLGHLTLVEELNRLKPKIIGELGFDRGRAVITYLQFVIDKCVDYNSRQTRWIPQRRSVSGTFGRHDFSLKWTFGEIVFSGPHSGVAWALSQVVDAYSGIAELVEPLTHRLAGREPPVRITCGSAASLDVPDRSVDLICMDPPYYNNVQYAELSDFYYVWQRRSLEDLYPDIYYRRLTNKADEAVANPARDGSGAAATEAYEGFMKDILRDCNRVLKDDGLLTMMFTHKTQSAWEALTESLIQNGWIITGAFPVESEFENSQHIMDNASAASSIFLSCRKRPSTEETVLSTWTGFGGTGVSQKVRAAVTQGLHDFEPLDLNPVDEMVASYGRALKVLSEAWPVIDGDEMVSPRRAMDEASAVVSEHRIAKMTDGRLSVDNLGSETAMALTLYGLFGLGYFAYDQALNISRSLGIGLESKPAGYAVGRKIIGINTELPSRATPRAGQRGRYSEGQGYFAPLVRRGSKLRLVLPSERNQQRLDNPQTEWDLLQGLIMAFREGDTTVARSYLANHAGDRTQVVLDLLSVWTSHAIDESNREEGKVMLFGLRQRKS